MYRLVRRGLLIRRTLLATVSVLVAGFGGAAGADPVPEGAVWSEATIESPDGTSLHADVFRPADGGQTPVILIPGRYFGLGDNFLDLDRGRPELLSYYEDIMDRAFERGYTVIQLTVRGYGASEGCTDHVGAGERADVIAGIRWAARQPWSTGKVGTYGLSYDGFLQFAALSERLPEHAAAVPMGAHASEYRAFYYNRVRYMPFSLLEPVQALYHTWPFVDPLALEAATAAYLSRFSNPGCLIEKVNWTNPDPDIPFWQERDYEDRVAGTTVPVMWSMGLLDWGIHPDGLDAVWGRLAGPKRLWLGQHEHLAPSEWERGHPGTVGREGWTEEVFRFLDRHLKGADPPADPPVVVQEGSQGGWRGEPEWPPADAVTSGLPLLPGAYSDSPGNKGELFCLRLEPSCIPGPSGNGSWTFSAPLPHDAHLSGTPNLEVTVDPAGVNVVGLLYDIDEQSRATLISRGAAIAGSAKTEFNLYLQDWLLRGGHRLGLLISGTDDWWFEPGKSLARAEVSSGVLRLPFLTYRRENDLSGGPSQAIRDRTSFSLPLDPASRTVQLSPLPTALAGRPGTSSQEAPVAAALSNAARPTKRCRRKKKRRASKRCRRRFPRPSRRS